MRKLSLFIKVAVPVWLLWDVALGSVDKKLYQVTVQVIERSDNIKAAKQAAYVTAAINAYRILQERFVQKKAIRHASNPFDVLSLVLSHRITHELFFNKSYKATYLFQFDGHAFSDFVGPENLLKTITASTIIVPILTDNGQSLLFQEENVWLQAWEEQVPFSRSPLILPGGTGRDLVWGQYVLEKTQRHKGIKEGLDVYGASYMALVMVNTLPQKEDGADQQKICQNIDVMLYNDKRLLETTGKVSFKQENWEEAKQQVVSFLNCYFDNVYSNTGPVQDLTLSCVVVKFKTIDDFSRLYRNITSSQDLKLVLSSLSLNKAVFLLPYRADMATIKPLFQKNGFSLEKKAQQWHAWHCEVAAPVQ